MNNFPYNKYVMAPTQGVDFSTKSHLLKETQWQLAEYVRCSNGIVSAFPGWRSILASPSGSPFISLLAEFRHADQTRQLIVGDATKLYTYNIATKALVDISAGNTFAPTRAYPWHATAYNNVFYMVNKVDGMWKFSGSGGVSHVANSPKGWSINVLNNHICVFGVDTNPWTFQWATVGLDDFVATAINDAGQFDIIDNDDSAQNLLPLDMDLIGYKDRSIHSFTYIGGIAVMGHRRMVSDVGLLSPDGIAPFTDRHIFMGDPPGFYEFSGGNSVDPTIGRPVEDKVFSELAFNKKNLCKALILYNSNEIIFYYANALAVSSANRAVVYNYREKVWYGPFDITGSEVTACVSYDINFSSVIDSFPNIIDTVPDLIDTFGQSISSGTPLFGTEKSDVMAVDGFDGNGTTLNRQCWSSDIFPGLNASDSFGKQISLPLGTMFQIVNVKIEYTAGGGVLFNYYIGSRLSLTEPIQWSGPFDTGFQQTNGYIEYPVRTRPGRWFISRFDVINNAALNLASIQYFFSVIGER